MEGKIRGEKGYVVCILVLALMLVISIFNFKSYAQERITKEPVPKKDFYRQLMEYKTIVMQRPNTKEGEKAQFALGELYFGQGIFLEAIREYQQYLDRYPRGDLRAQAQFKIGESYYRVKSYNYALLAYQKVIDLYPDCIYRGESQERIKEVSIALAKQEAELKRESASILTPFQVGPPGAPPMPATGEATTSAPKPKETTFGTGVLAPVAAPVEGSVTGTPAPPASTAPPPTWWQQQQREKR